MTPATRRFFFFLVSLHVQLQQRRLTSHLGETTCTFYLIIFFMIDRLYLMHPYTYLSSVPSVPSLLLAYLQSTIRYRHSRIHTADPRRVVVVGCSLPPSLPHAKRKYTNIPYLTSVLVPPYLLLLLLCTYTSTVHKGGRVHNNVSRYLDIS